VSSEGIDEIEVALGRMARDRDREPSGSMLGPVGRTQVLPLMLRTEGLSASLRLSSC